MRPKRRSSGVATAEAMVSGLAPGQRRADAGCVGKVDARQRRDRQLRERRGAREQQRRGEQRGRDPAGG